MSTQALNDLPLFKLISEPLNAAASAHLELSKSNIDILSALSSEDNKSFEFKRDEIDDNGNTITKTITVTVPTLSLIDLPTFTLESLRNEFTFEVSTVQDSLEEKTGSLKGSASAGGFISKFVDFNLEAGYDKRNKVTNSNSERGKLNIIVTATKSESQPQGMKTIIDAAIKSITSKEV